MDKLLDFRRILLFLQFVGIILVNGKRVSMLSGTSDLATITAKIMRTCYSERIKEIGLAGNFSDSFFASVASGDSPFSTVFINDERSLMTNGVVPLMLRYKLQIFAVAVTSSSELKDTLVEIKNSRWWNHMAKYYIFDSGEEIRCSDAFEFLWTAWMMDILNAKFICNHNDDGPLIYMFNPYTNNAGDHWKLERIYKGVDNHPWTLFVRKYDETIKNCQNIDFDQTKNPGGYKVRISLPKENVLPNYSEKGQYVRSKLSNQKIQILQRHLNLTIIVVLHSANKSLGFIDENGKGHGMMEDLTSGRCDILFQFVPITIVPDLSTTSWLRAELVAVTRYTEYPTQWHKFISAIDYSSRIGLCIVVVINIIFLKFALRQSFMKAFLNTLRIVCDSCLVELPKKSGPRIYLACLFFFFIIIQALYQGQLSARLTKHVRYPNINDKSDLMKSDLILYGQERYRVIFSENAYEGRFVPFENELDCLNQLPGNSSFACVGRKEFIINDTIKSKLHMSKDAIAEFLMKYPSRKNWPLEEKYQRFNLNLMTSGVHEYIYRTAFSQEMRILDVNENGNDHESFKVIMLKDLDFAFIIFGIGLGCAIVSFAIELYIRPNRSPRTKKRVRLAWR